MEGETWENAGDDTIHISRLVNSVLRLGDGGAGADLSIVLAPSYADSYSIRKPIFHHSLVVAAGRHTTVLQFYDFSTGSLLATVLRFQHRFASGEPRCALDARGH